jgi:hypothetical protein
LTCREMLFSSLCDFGTGCIIAVMCPSDDIYPPLFSFPWFCLPCPCDALLVAYWFVGGALFVFPS